jgi:hypothetical protein
MPSTIQGFVEVSQFINNTPGNTSPFGELSTFSATFSKERGIYQNNALPGYTLHTFRASDSNGAALVLTADEVLEIFEIVRDVIVYAQSHQRPYDMQDFVATVQTDQATKINSLGFGDLVAGTAISLPAFLSWKRNNSNDEVRVWLSDLAFRGQFTGFEITVIPPIDQLGDFFLPYSQVKEQLDAVSLSDFMAKIQVAKDGHPDTFTRIMEFDFYNRFDQQVKTTCRFGILIYGQEGDYIDAIKDAIVAYLLANSSYGEDQWATVLPDVFKRTEMIIVPRWDKQATENLTEQGSLYSQITNPHNSLTFVRDFIGNTTLAYLQVHTNTLPFAFKTLMAYVVNGVNNEEGKTNFAEMFSDYLPIPSTSVDFGRMSLETQQWALFIDDILLLAEKVTPLTSLPTGVRRVIRNGKTYLAALHDGVNYLVAAKANGVFN